MYFRMAKKAGGFQLAWLMNIPELKTLEGILANPELVGGRFHNCPVGWGCRIVNDNLKIVHQLEANGIEVFDHGSGANLGASIASAFADDAPWFGYYWGPTAVLGKYEMTKVDIGDVDLNSIQSTRMPIHLKVCLVCPDSHQHQC